METGHTLPRFIALCGNPLSGKTTTAELLEELFGYKLVDDGGFLRRIAMEHFGAKWDDVYTQEGKMRKTVINGEEMTWRDVLGRIGNGFEAQFGANVIPEIAYNGLPKIGKFVFASVRREQGAYHRARGALVLEITNALAGPSTYEFDRYNPAHVHATVANDYIAKGLSPALARKQLGYDLENLVRQQAGVVHPMAA